MNAGRVVALLGGILVRLRAVLAIVAMVVALIGLGVPAASASRAALVVNGHEAAETATGGYLALTGAERGLATSARPEATLNPHGYDSTLVASAACTTASAEIGSDLGVHGAAAALDDPRWSYDSSETARVPSRLDGCRLTPSGTPQVLANQRMGNAAADSIAARFPGSSREVTLQAASGPRRLDVLTESGLAIESKVGRTSLTSATRQQIARDVELLAGNPRVTGLRWEFFVSPVTGKGWSDGPVGSGA